MKKLLCMLLIACMALGLSACGTQAAAETPAAAPAQTDAAAGGGASAEPSGEPSGEASGSAADAGEPTDIRIVYDAYEQPDGGETDLTGLYTGEDCGPSQGDCYVAAGETWFVSDSCTVDRLEIEPGAQVEADFPVIVFFSQSDTVGNGDVIGNVQFVCDYDETVAIVHTNDTHGFMQLEPYVKGLKDQLAASGKYSLILAVNAGDQYAGGYAAAHVYEGEYIPYVMSGIYDYMTWGNNDGGLSDQGMSTYLLAALGNAEGTTTLLANLKAAEPVSLSSYAASYEPAVGAEEFAALYPDAVSLNEDGTLNFDKLDPAQYDLETGGNPLDDGAIVETANGTKLGLFGVSTNGGSITDAYFTGMATQTVAQAMTDALADEGATAVVMLGHVGWLGADSTQTSSNDTNSAQLAMKTDGLDAIIDAHTHSVINDGEGWLFAGYGRSPIVNQASCKGEAIGVLYLYLKDGRVVAKDCENLVPGEDGAVEGVLPDAQVQAAVDRCYDRLAADGYTEVWASTEYYLNGDRISTGNPAGGVRANETNLGDLVADGILWTAQQLWQGEPISIALYPGFWVRSSIEPGDITLVDAMSVFANPLKIYYAQYTAAELVALMTTSCSKLGEENNNMFQVAGLRCTYDPATKAVVSLTVGDECIYENGEYLVGEDWTVGCAAEVGGGNMNSVPDDSPLLIVPSKEEMARCWCRFLAEADYTIYPDELCPDGRVVPAE